MSRLRDRRGWVLGIVLFGTLGCGSGGGTPTPPKQPFLGKTIVAAAVGDPAILKSLIAQRGEWTATRGAELTVKPTPVAPKSASGVDVLVFRADQLGDMIDSGLIGGLAESTTRPPAPTETVEPPPGSEAETIPADPLEFEDILPVLREQVTRYGGERMALPYGGTALVLVYHRQAFERDENRAAAKELKLALEPPKTWDQFDALAKFFQGRDWNGDGTKDHGVALAFGADPEALGDSTFLARAASLGAHRDQYSFLFDSDTMAPRISSLPFVEALEAMVALKASAPPEAAAFGAEAARKAFADGKAAMLIDRAERLATWGKSKAIGVVPLPGSNRVYDPANARWETVSTPNTPSYLPYGGGWVVAVSASASSESREAAIDFAKYLISPEISSRIRSDRSFPMLPIRGKLVLQGPPDPAATPGIDGRQWADAVSRTLLAAKVIAGLRIPEAEGYLEDLSKGRLAAVGGTPAKSALETVEKAWTERTKRLGDKRQLWYYRRSISNSLATLPQPPDR